MLLILQIKKKTEAEIHEVTVQIGVKSWNNNMQNLGLKHLFTRNYISGFRERATEKQLFL